MTPDAPPFTTAHLECGHTRPVEVAVARRTGALWCAVCQDTVAVVEVESDV